MSSHQNYFEFVNVTNVPKEFTCEICAYPLVNPKICNPCGHAVCGHCAERLEQDGSRNCHMCRQPRNGFCRNIFAEQLLAEVKATCQGCNNDVPLPAIQQHVTVQCQEIEDKCSQCQTCVKRSDTQAHNQMCPKANITCDCGIVILRQDEENHRQDCKLKEVQCCLGCEESIKRYLLPSHCMSCPKVVEQCPIRGCGQYHRREDMPTHLADKVGYHFDLLKRERTQMLWTVAKGQLHVTPQRSSSEAFVITWSPLPVQDTSVLASPQFERVNRKWRLYFKQGIVRLHFVQGLEDIAVIASFIIKTRDGRKKAFQKDDVAHLKEGAFIEANTNCSNPPECITVRIEVNYPKYLKI